MNKNVFTGRIVNVEVGKVVLPNGYELDMEKIVHPGGAAVVAVDDQQQVCLLKQYRCVFDEWLWELPAGKIDNQEQPLLTAQRELKEETGISANNWNSLGSMVSSPGVFTERVHLYLASDFSEMAAVANEQDEVYELHWVNFIDACNWAAQGKISDAKSVIGLFRARAVIDGFDGVNEGVVDLKSPS